MTVDWSLSLSLPLAVLPITKMALMAKLAPFIDLGGARQPVRHHVAVRS